MCLGLKSEFESKLRSDFVLAAESLRAKCCRNLFFLRGLHEAALAFMSLIPVTAHKLDFSYLVCMPDLVSTMIVENLMRFGFVCKFLPFLWFAHELQFLQQKMIEASVCVSLLEVFILHAWIISENYTLAPQVSLCFTMTQPIE